MNPEDFEVGADRDGQMYLRCTDYGRGCWWETPFGIYTPIGDDLGSLLDAAREHVAAEHPSDPTT